MAIYSSPVTTEGRIELLPFLREQAISITAHRFGNPDAASGDVLRGTVVGAATVGVAPVESEGGSAIAVDETTASSPTATSVGV